MSRKNIIVLIITGLLLFQVIIMVMPYVILLNPSNGLFWQPIEYANKPKQQTISLPGMESNATVIYDEWGVPHIFANSLNDVFEAFGYVQARDRLFQMDMIRRMIEGRLSEVLGEYTLKSDIYYRTLGLADAAKKSIEKIRTEYPQVYDYVVAFSRGVNYYIENGELPIEMLLLNYIPYKWEPYHTLLVAKMIEYGLTFTTWDLERRALVEALGSNRTDEIFPMIDYELFPILQQNETWYPSKVIPQSIIKDKLGYKTIKEIPKDKLNDVLELLREIQTTMQLSYFFKSIGSNNWVVGGDLTETGKPLLANDPHLQLTVPPVWYEAQLVVPGKLNVRGVTFPGVPFIIIGHNDKVAWGVTNVGADVIDYYYYKWVNDTHYYYNGTIKKVEQRVEKIKVYGENGYYNVTLIVNSTVHGPLLEYKSARYAVKWTGLMATLEAVAIFKYDTAQNIDDFIEGLRLFHIPGQNLVYADIYGNFMYYPSALYPIRKNLKTDEIVAGNMPFNGSNLEGEWVGFIPFEDIPHALNTTKGFIVTANNRPVTGDYPYYIGDSMHFAAPYRAMRITEMIQQAINEKGYITIDDFKKIQADSHSIFARIMTPLLLDAIKGKQLTPTMQQAVNILENWDYDATSDKAAPTIFAMWLALYREFIFADEYKQANITGLEMPEPETIQYMTENPEKFSYWFDNKTTPETETMSDIAYTALEKTIEILTNKFGTDNPSEWIYGKIHLRHVTHLLGSVLTWLNYPDMPDNGSWFTVNPVPFEPFSSKWYSTIGPSWRQIIDLSNFDNSLCIIPGGQSGNPYSKHYDDQYWLWLRKEYKQMTFPTKISDIPSEQIESILYINTGG